MLTLLVLQGPDKGRRYELPDAPALVGRDSRQLPLTDNTVSRRHAELIPGPDSWILTSRSVLAGANPVTRVVRDQGNYDVLDERGYDADDLCLAFLGDVVKRHPRVLTCAVLPDAQVATFDGAGDAWTPSHVDRADRRTSTRCWTLAQPAVLADR